MIPNKTDGTLVTGNLTGAEVTMSIDETAIAHIMSILTDLYSDPEQAIVREYSTNALDAQKAAGVTTPIEVWTPTDFSPVLRIRDNGVGLNAEDIKNVYSRYGTSTKRASDEFSGLMGIGCKSALAYSSQFTVVGRKNGIKTTIVVSRNEEGVGSMTTADQSMTTEADGVEIQIPCRRGNKIREKAEQFFAYWPKGSVLLDGKAPAFFAAMAKDGGNRAEKITDDLYIVTGSNNGRGYGYANEDVIVMGGVAYPVRSDDALVNRGVHSWQRKYSVVYFAPMGAVDFVPSREALNYTPRVRNYLTATADQIKATIATHANTAVSRATTGDEALRSMLLWSDLIGYHSGWAVWNGQTMPTKFVGKGLLSNGTTPGGIKVFGTLRTQWSRSAYSTSREISARDLLNGTHLVVTGFKTVDPTRLSSTNRSYIKRWLALNSRSEAHIVVVPERFGGIWLPDSLFVDWETMRDEVKAAIKAERPVAAKGMMRSSSVLPVTYDVVEHGENYPTAITADAFPAGKRPIHIAPDDWRELPGHFTTHFHALSDRPILITGRNRFDKVARDYNSEPFKEALAGIVKDVFAAVSEAERTWLATSSHSNYTGFDDARIEDPDLARHIRHIKSVSGNKRRMDALVYLARHVCAASLLPDLKAGPIAKYPLIFGCGFHFGNDTAGKRKGEHAYLYINAVHKARQAATTAP